MPVSECKLEEIGIFHFLAHGMLILGKQPPCNEEAQMSPGRSPFAEKLITSYVSILELPGGLNNRNILSDSSGGQKSETKVLV